jgi:SAM-dependent methyltransferase
VEYENLKGVWQMTKLRFEDVKGYDEVENVWKNTPGKLESKDDFMRFFDDSEDFEKVVKMGFIDFSHKIFTPDFYQLIGDPREKTCLEIGFGGGRLLNVASHFFGRAIGIDIHNDFDRTSSILKELRSGKCNLIKNDQFFTVESETVDFVYSFIVFQHFDRWKVAEEYLDEIERVLSLDGAGIIYFGMNRQNEKFIETNGRQAEKKACTLQVSSDFAISEMQKRFSVFEAAVGPKRPWDLRASSQFYIKFANKKHSRLTVENQDGSRRSSYMDSTS